MRVLQLIDSLRSGGAERMSVTYANALAKRIEGSYLCCTRMEGLLKQQLSPEVGYLFLNKKSTLDLQAFLKLRKFVKEHNVGIIHAHGSSWFLALLVKASLSKVKLIWHDHWGERALKDLSPGILKPASKHFDGVITANPDLKEWAQRNLYSANISFIPNFIPDYQIQKDLNVEKVFTLKGDPDSLRIVCLANLRAPKDHMTLLRAFKKVINEYPNSSLHLVGKDEDDNYSKFLKKFIKVNELQDKVFLYGEQGDLKPFLLSADIGVLSSKTEGLPVALLEYGFYCLPVVCTGVGQCGEIVGDYGCIVPPENPDELADGIIGYIKKSQLRIEHANAFHTRVLNNFSGAKVMENVISFYLSIAKLC